MTGTRDRFGELIEPPDDDNHQVLTAPGGTAQALPDEKSIYVGNPDIPRTPDEIRAHCEELRAVLAESRARREADQ